MGMVTDRDLKEASPSKATTLDVHELYYLLAELQVQEIMSRNPISVSQDDTVERAAQIMLEHTISGLPVVDAGGHLVGIITQSDVFRAFMHITGVLQGGAQFALRLEDRPGILKEVADMMRDRGGRLVSLLDLLPHPGGKHPGRLYPGEGPVSRGGEGNPGGTGQTVRDYLRDSGRGGGEEKKFTTKPPRTPRNKIKRQDWQGPTLPLFKILGDI